MTEPITKDIVVFYHGNCRDGFTAAWAAWKKFGDSAEYIPLIWSNLMPDQIPPIKDKEVYFLDFTPTKEEVERIIKNNKSVVVIDHHASKEELVKTLPGSIYDVSHSGAVLAWNYFHAEKTMPQVCLYVEDSDIWKWSVPGSDEVLNVFDLKRDYDFKVWDTLATELEDEAIRKDYYEKGKLLLVFRKKIVESIIREQTQLVNFEGHEVYATNGPRYLKSEIGAELSKMKPPFGIIWSYTPEEISVSLRSIKEFNLIPIAQKFGGGGHENASNFRLSLGALLPWEIIEPYHGK